VRRLLWATLLAVAGCFPHRLVEHPGIPAPEDFPQAVRVVRFDGTSQDLVNARVSGDTIHGEAWDRRRFSIPAATVARLEVRRFSLRQTLTVVGTVALAVLLSTWMTDDPWVVCASTAPCPFP